MYSKYGEHTCRNNETVIIKDDDDEDDVDVFFISKAMMEIQSIFSYEYIARAMNMSCVVSLEKPSKNSPDHKARVTKANEWVFISKNSMLKLNYLYFLHVYVFTCKKNYECMSVKWHWSDFHSRTKRYGNEKLFNV